MFNCTFSTKFQICQVHILKYCQTQTGAATLAYPALMPTTHSSVVRFLYTFFLGIETMRNRHFVNFTISEEQSNWFSTLDFYNSSYVLCTRRIRIGEFSTNYVIRIMFIDTNICVCIRKEMEYQSKHIYLHSSSIISIGGLIENRNGKILLTHHMYDARFTHTRLTSHKRDEHAFCVSNMNWCARSIVSKY